MNSPQEVNAVLKVMNNEEMESDDLQFRDSAFKNLQAAQKVFEENKRRILSTNFKVFEIPGRFEKSIGGYFLNGLMFHTPSEKRFLTTSLSNKPTFVNAFARRMDAHKIHLVFQDCSDHRGGGIH